jgi:hypothetical protein
LEARLLLKSANFTLSACAVVALAGFASANSFTGPTSVFYLDVGGSEKIYAVQGTNATFFGWAYDSGGGANGEAILAVTTGYGVSTAPNAQSPFSGSGGEYTLAGVSTGIANLASAVPAYDGTSDGSYNYYVRPGGNDDVYQSNLDWSSPTVLFSTLSIGTFQGIAYDPLNNSLWLSESSSPSEIEDFSMTGTFLSSFVQTAANHVEALGFDPADGTLWGTLNQTGTLAQWDTNGNLLQQGTVSGLPSGNYLSGNFVEGNAGPVTTPEPATLLLTGSGIFALIRRFRKK